MLHRWTALRIVEIVVGVAVVAIVFAYRWRQASATSDARARELAAARSWCHELRSHPAIGELHRFLSTQGIGAGFGPAGPGQFEIVFLDAVDAVGQRVAPSDPRVAFFRAWLEGPRRLLASLAMPARTPHVREVVAFEWPAEMHALRG